MSRVLITGAAGLIGGIARAELERDHELILVDRRAAPGVLRHDLRWYWDDLPLVPRTLPWRSWWAQAFTGADVAVHLAANGNPFGSRRRAGRDNIRMTRHVLHAAARFGVPRVVFASSTWAVKGLERSLAPACYAPGGPKIGADAPPTPIGWYGRAKAIGEEAGRAMVEQGRLTTFIAVRIGWCPARGLRAVPEDAALWIGQHDLARLLRRCVEADLTGAHVVHGTSGQPESPYDLASTRDILDWVPDEAAPAATT